MAGRGRPRKPRDKTKSKNSTPHQLTEDLFKRLGWTYDRTESYNKFAGRTKDLFGFIDVMALTGESIIGAQATSPSNHAARKNKIEELPAAISFLKSGGRIVVISWAWKPTGWNPRIEECRLQESSQGLSFVWSWPEPFSPLGLLQFS